MSVAQKVFISLFGALLFFVIVSGSFVAGISRVVTDKNYVKETLGQESIYDAVAKAVVEQPFQNANVGGEATSEEATVNQQSIQKLIDRFLTADNYRTNIGVAVDGVYSWMEGETQKPQFQLQLAQDKAAFQQFVIETVSSQYSALPPCDNQAIAGEFNPLDADCQLPGYDSTDVEGYIRTNSQDPEFANIFNNAAISSDDIFGEVTPQTTDSVQRLYRFLQASPWVVFAAITVITAAIMLVAHSRRRSFQVTALALIVPGVIVLAGGLIGLLARNSLVESTTPELSSEGSDAMAQLAREVVAAILEKVNGQVLLIGGVVLGTSVFMLTAHWFLNRSPRPPAAVGAPKGQAK